MHDECRRWNAQWINIGKYLNDWRAPARPAPLFRRRHVHNGTVGRATVFLCGLGYQELYLNGQKVGDGVLDPVVSQYDKHVHYLAYDVSGLLRPGENVFGVMLGTGWYNPQTAEVWHFDKAPWRDYPKMVFELEIDGAVVLSSDADWRFTEEGPIRFDALRNGEHYDARREIPGWSEPGFDDSSWRPAVVMPGPGGDLIRQTQPSCRVVATLPAATRPLAGADNVLIADLGENIAGWSRIAVSGPAGATVKLAHAERLDEKSGDIDQENIGLYILSGETQTDHYTLKGEGVEVWEPRFTFHGFQYARVELAGGARLENIEGRVVRTGFAEAGEFDSSDETLNALWRATRRAYAGNFVGIPTDCPHREKNGWTGDAAIAVDTGLFLYDAAESYRTWMGAMRDSQRNSGQFSGIVPTGGWGYNWGSGPVWDAAFIFIPWAVHVYTGERRILEENFDAMLRYLRFLGTLAQGHLVLFGLGDWCPVDESRMVPPVFTSTAYYYREVATVAKIALRLGHEDRASELSALAREIRAAFLREFHRGAGLFANGGMTASAVALSFGLCPEDEREVTALALAGSVRANGNKVDFGIIGGKFVPRALAENGYVDDAYRLVVQRAFPGWAHWLERGATTLWETWDGGASRNHIMFGDIAAWMMDYLAGLAPDEANPGFIRPVLRPLMPAGLSRASAYYCLSGPGNGGCVLRSGWRREGGRLVIAGELPADRGGELILPDGGRRVLSPGSFEFVVEG